MSMSAAPIAEDRAARSQGLALPRRMLRVRAGVDVLCRGEKFKFLFVSGLGKGLDDVQGFFKELRQLCLPEAGLQVDLDRCPFRREDVALFLELAGFDEIGYGRTGWLPWARAGVLTARLPPERKLLGPPPSVSVIIPARNEAGNISAIFRRIPEMGAWTELIFVEGHSSDGTFAAIERESRRHPQRSCQLLRQQGVGKGDAVRLGFERARGDVLMILDADLTVRPEDLPKFYQALVTGKGGFINGVRFVYPVPPEAMWPANRLGNRFFARVFSWLLGQRVRDTLCGTKVLWKKDWERLAVAEADWAAHDPFGDFHLLLGAARLRLQITDLPVRYEERTYGTTNIHRWRHGWQLLKLTVRAALRMK